MKRIPISDVLITDCPIRQVLSRIGDKWTVLVLCILNESEEPMRFASLQKSIPDISQKMLTQTLRTLVQDGLVERVVYAEVPPRVEYSLTPRAHSLMPHLNSLIGWAKENMADILRDRGNI